MCVVSMVFDHYKDKFQPYKLYYEESWNFDKVLQDRLSKISDLEIVKRLIKDFETAVKAAKLVDKLTAQPDCEDPEKAKLVIEVERLQKIVDELLLQLTKARAK